VTVILNVGLALALSGIGTKIRGMSCIDRKSWIWLLHAEDDFCHWDQYIHLPAPCQGRQ